MELIDGRIVEKTSQNDPHILAVHFAQQALMAAFGPGFTVLVQSSLRIAERSKPEPDLAVIRGPLQGRRTLPTASPADIARVVEVSETTLAYDQGEKAALYAAHRIAEYWLVNLPNRTLEVRRQPEDGRYREGLAYTEDERVSIGGVIAVADLLPEAA